MASAPETKAISRRLLLKGGALVAAGSFLPSFARRALAAEAAPAQKKTFVFLFLRGALDGLFAVTPYGEPRLQSLRPALLLPEPGGAARSAQQQPLLSLGVPGFGLHPALEPLLPMWREGSLALVHACGQPQGSRSHFDAQDFLELGTPGVKSTPDGWLARARAQASNASLVSPRSPLDAVAIAARLPRSLQGGPDALAFANLDQLRLRPLAGAPGGPKGRTQSRASFEALYEQSPDALAVSGKEAFAALELLEKKLGPSAPPPSVPYPNGPVAAALRQLAQLIKADVGLRVGVADAGGWDTHSNQPGQLNRNLADLAQAIAAFHRDLGERMRDVVLVAATEFGRTVRQNGALGTDHGSGSVALVLGGEVSGGKLHGRWPGLADDQLFEGRDLAVATDLRSVLAAAVASQLGVRDVGKLFPGFTGAALAGLMRPAAGPRAAAGP